VILPAGDGEHPMLIYLRAFCNECDRWPWNSPDANVRAEYKLLQRRSLLYIIK
jgi:hypothetical protein